MAAVAFQPALDALESASADKIACPTLGAGQPIWNSYFLTMMPQLLIGHRHDDAGRVHGVSHVLSLQDQGVRSVPHIRRV